MNCIRILVIALLANVTCVAQSDLTDRLKPPVAGLVKADLASVKMNADTIARLIKSINTTPPNDFRGIVVIKNNNLVVEEYFNTYWRETIHDIRSAGKSVTALLLGIAIDKGLVKSTEQSIYDFFPSAKFDQPKKDGHQEIKIKHLLAMSSGLSADDDDNNSPGGTGNWITANHWVNFATSLPMIFKSGEKFVYNDICPMLVGALIEETSGKKLADFAKENLFTPLGIREYYWYTALNGSTAPMGNLYLTTLDFAKLGQLVINKGNWQGKQVISSTWINEMLTKQLAFDDGVANGYGYFWWRATRQVNGKKYECIYASGNGGNVLFIVPTENLVVSLTSSAYGQRYAHRRSRAIFDSVLRSLKE